MKLEDIHSNSDDVWSDFPSQWQIKNLVESPMKTKEKAS